MSDCRLIKQDAGKPFEKVKRFTIEFNLSEEELSNVTSFLGSASSASQFATGSGATSMQELCQILKNVYL